MWPQLSALLKLAEVVLGTAQCGNSWVWAWLGWLGGHFVTQTYTGEPEFWEHSWSLNVELEQKRWNSEWTMGTEATLLKEFVGFLPIFLLHISTGMTASFTTILIHYFEHTQPHLKEYSTLIGRICLLLPFIIPSLKVQRLAAVEIMDNPRHTHKPRPVSHIST